MNVIFNKPLRFGKINYPKSPRPQEVPDGLKDDKYFQLQVAENNISFPSAEGVAVVKKEEVLAALKKADKAAADAKKAESEKAAADAKKK